MLILGIVLFLALLILGAPIFTALGIGAAVICLYYAGFPLHCIGDMFVSNINSFILLAIPLYIFAGYLMLKGGASKPLVELMRTFTGHLPGGLGIATVCGCAFFAALTGSSAATVSAIGAIMIPPMIALGYGRKFPAGLVASSGSLGNLIPPSVTFIIYGALVEVSVGKLFMAGILPGLLLSAALVCTAMLFAKKEHFPLQPKADWHARWHAFVKAIPALTMPLIILGGIYSGIFTPTEAAAVACIYALLIGFFVYRKLNIRSLWDTVSTTVRTTGMIMLLITAAILLAKMFAYAAFPQAMSTFVAEAHIGKAAFMLLSILVLVILGTILEALPLMYVTVPILLPTAVCFGVSPIHFGVLICVALQIGQCTPPVATLIYLTSGISGIPADEVIRGVVPFVITMIVVLIILAFLPEISLFLPAHM